MNKKISIAVGVAAAVAFTGTAMANNTQTVNSSEGYVKPEIAIGFIPEFVYADCTSGGGGTGNCNDHGAVAAGNAAGTTIVFTNPHTGGPGDPTTEANAGYFANPDMMPVLQYDIWSGGVGGGQHIIGNAWANISGYAWTNAAPFSSGLMSWDRGSALTGKGGGASYFDGLSLGWTGYSDAAKNAERPMGMPQGSAAAPGGTTDNARDEWVDQTVVGYIESLNNAVTPASNYDQNFRSQLSWVGGNVATASAHIDQRLEQDLTLADAPNNIAFEASRQTLQTAFAVNSNTGSTTAADGTGVGGSGGEGSIDNDPTGFTGTSGIGQLVTQDVEGWFYSCLNCDSTLNSVSHAFTPFETSLTFMPYTNTWRDLPSITHGGQTASDNLDGTSPVGQSRNLVSYANAPGVTGP